MSSEDLVARLRERTRSRLPPEWRKDRLCPECKTGADRPKCFWDMGPSCPRLDPDNYEPSPYVVEPDPLSQEAAKRIEELEDEIDEMKADARGDAFDRDRGD